MYQTYALNSVSKRCNILRAKLTDYVLALKVKQKNLYEEVKEYFGDEEFQKKIEEQGGYKKTIEKAHGQVE